MSSNLLPSDAIATSAVHPVFMEQAKALVCGGELLPGGIEPLARRLQKAADTQTPLRVKLGLDPTRPDLHLGHSVVLKKLRMFQDLGHQAVLIIGDATALIGDPSGKNQTRPPLSPQEVDENAQTYLAQAGKIILVNRAEILRNSQWLGTLSLSDWLQLASMVTVAQLLVRDDFAKRYKANQPIALHELLYPMMQGYDSVAVGADIELGGTDQRFNNLMGRELHQSWMQRQLPPPFHPEVPKMAQLVLLLPLLEGTDGVIKMSKSYPQHCINLTDEPADMFGKLMSIPDNMILRYEELLMPLNEAQLAQHADMLKKPADQGGMNPRDMKAHLAKWLVATYHSPECAEAAEVAFNQLFRNKQLPDDMPEISLPANTSIDIPSLLVEHALSASKGEVRRLMVGGGLRVRYPERPADEGQKLLEPEQPLAGQPPGAAIVIQAGKRKFLKLNFQ
ncbi:MAG: tyrosine--tRNA ligase [Vampirovibrionales bacterium]|nr:tyrosine--tRNA ligase [Vampirovibrionales bacterium]